MLFGRIKILKGLVIFIFIVVSSPVFALEAIIDPTISKMVSVDSWKCNEFFPKIDPKCRFRAIYYDQLKSESSPYLEIQILKWEFYGKPMRLIVWKKIDVRSNEKTLAASEKLFGEPAIGCCDFRNLRWEKLELKYNMFIGGKSFSCVLKHLTEKNFDINCREM